MKKEGWFCRQGQFQFGSIANSLTHTKWQGIRVSLFSTCIKSWNFFCPQTNKKNEKKKKRQNRALLLVSQQILLQGTYLNIIEEIYSEPSANIKFNGEKHAAIPLTSGTRQGGLHCLPIYKIEHWKFKLEQIEKHRRSNGYKSDWKS